MQYLKSWKITHVSFSSNAVRRTCQHISRESERAFPIFFRSRRIPSELRQPREKCCPPSAKAKGHGLLLAYTARRAYDGFKTVSKIQILCCCDLNIRIRTVDQMNPESAASASDASSVAPLNRSPACAYVF